MAPRIGPHQLELAAAPALNTTDNYSSEQVNTAFPNHHFSRVEIGGKSHGGKTTKQNKYSFPVPRSIESSLNCFDSDWPSNGPRGWPNLTPRHAGGLWKNENMFGKGAGEGEEIVNKHFLLCGTSR